jgi:hypothetical protein
VESAGDLTPGEAIVAKHSNSMAMEESAGLPTGCTLFVPLGARIAQTGYDLLANHALFNS